MVRISNPPHGAEDAEAVPLLGEFRAAAGKSAYSFDAAVADTLDEVALEEEEDQRHGQGGQHRPAINTFHCRFWPMLPRSKARPSGSV